MANHLELQRIAELKNKNQVWYVEHELTEEQKLLYDHLKDPHNVEDKTVTAIANISVGDFVIKEGSVINAGIPKADFHPLTNRVSGIFVPVSVPLTEQVNLRVSVSLKNLKMYPM